LWSEELKKPYHDDWHKKVEYECHPQPEKIKPEHNLKSVHEIRDERTR
jgi:hypothetical protein